MLRFLLLLAIISTSVIIAIRKSDLLYDELLYQEAMVRFIAFVRRSIQGYRMPIDEILQGVAVDIFDDDEILDDMKQQGIHGGFSRHSNLFGYDSLTLRSVEEFFRRLGGLVTSDQLTACDDVLSILSESLHKKRELYPKQRKVYLTLGFTVGIGLSILLI